MKAQHHIPKPSWIRSKLPLGSQTSAVKRLLRTSQLATVCEEAACPNLGECFNCGTATFLILGNTCTRNCRFCNVTHGKPEEVNEEEPRKVAEAVSNLQLKYAVLTSVTRDDLSDGGAEHFKNCIMEIRKTNSNVKIEILTPDFKHCMDLALGILKLAPPDVFNHNIETVPRLHKEVRPQANYAISLTLLKKHKISFPKVPTKSGLMLGLGETDAEIIDVLRDLRANDVSFLTLGQYLQPSSKHLPIVRFVTPVEFSNYAKLARDLGFTHVASGPMVRSSYHAEMQPIEK